MRKAQFFLLILPALCLCACSAETGAETEKNAAPESNPSASVTVNTSEHQKGQATEVPHTAADGEPSDTEGDNTDMIRLTVGNHIITAELSDTTAARALAELLSHGPIRMTASNFGGFEKVCELGTRLTSDDIQTVTQPGDIMLYSGDKIVIFYGSNTWAYTRLGRVVSVDGNDISGLREALSGKESEIVIELAVDCPA